VQAPYNSGNKKENKKISSKHLGLLDFVSMKKTVVKWMASLYAAEEIAPLGRSFDNSKCLSEPH